MKKSNLFFPCTIFRKYFIHCLVLVSIFTCSGKVLSQSMVIESLTGPITQKEINAFKTNLNKQSLPTSNKGNGLVYGGGGKNMEALGQMYEVTEDIEILNRLIQFADNALASRNDLALGAKDTIWTGKVDPVWPNYTAKSPRGWQYSGTENGDVIAHITYCAQLILERPSLWNQNVPVGDKFGFGTTYLDRAKKYVNECLFTMDNFVVPFHVRSNFQLQYPSDDRYKAIDDRHDKDSGGGAPWNQQAMLTGAFLRLARCMEILAINPDKVALYDKVVKTSIEWFISELHRYEQNGKYYYKWSYAAGDKNLKYMEDVGHGGYDITGIHRAYMSGRYGVSKEVMTGLANTLADIIMEPFPEVTRFKSYVDGLKDSGSTTARIGASYLYLCPFRTDLFQPLGNFHIGDRGLGDPLIISCMLWIKDKNYKNLWNAMEYKAVSIPGTVEAERYNLGGEGFGYHDLSIGNSGNLFRNDDVDIEKTSDSKGTYDVAISNGEWLNYTVVASATDKYSIELRAAAASAGNMQIMIDGSIVGTVNIPNTGGTQKWITVSLSNISISAGTREIRIAAQNNSINLNFINLVKGEVALNVPPTVTITSPANSALYTAPAAITINANAKDSDGSVTKVDFYNGSTLLGSDNTSPYSFVWNNVASGTYSITAKATDNSAATGTSAVVTIQVNAPVNMAPTVNITSPASNANFTAPASILINANATDSDGSVAKVDFYNGSTLLGTDNSAPYTVTWSNVGAGTYSIKAKATDNAGAITTSAAVDITVNNNTTDACSGLPKYVENNGYVDGSKVQNAGGVYQCKPYPYTGWCNGAAWAYAPGTGSYWTDAWTKVGTCSEKMASTNEVEGNDVLSIAPNPTSQSVRVKLNIQEETSVEYIILNVYGEEILKGRLDNSLEGTIDLSEMKSRVYTIRISTEENLWLSKIIKN